MKLARIQLHPFGGVTARSCEFPGSGLNVIEGPNEFGKSTLANALWHVLFTPTNLTPARLEKTMGRWYPRPDGDHAQVSLEFEADGKTWKLRKCWGAGRSSSLQAEGGPPVGDPDAVQAKLHDLLVRNEATWRQVLFLNQAQLNETLNRLASDHGQLDDYQSLLTGNAVIPGDIAIEKLDAVLEARIANHFSRWDRARGGPENGRGVENPWSKSVGPVLAAYYRLAGKRRDLEKVVEHERLIDNANRKVTDLDAEAAQHRDFVQVGRKLRDGLSQRSGLEEKVKRLQGEEAVLRKISVEWPGADQVMAGKRQEIEQVIKQIEGIEQELQVARKRQLAEQTRKDFQRIEENRNAHRVAVQKLAKAAEIPDEARRQLKGFDEEIRKLGIEIAAQKLKITMRSAKELSVRMTRGDSDPETLTVKPDTEWDGEAEGRLVAEFDDVTLEVASASGGDVQALFQQLDSTRAKRSELLESLGLKDTAEVEAAAQYRSTCMAEEASTRRLYQAALGDKTEEEWAALMKGLAELPETRSVATLEAQKTEFQNKRASLAAEIQQLEAKVRQWAADYGTPDHLMDQILEMRQQLKQAENDLEGLPKLPEGFGSTDQYLKELREREEQLQVVDEEMKNLKMDLSGLTASAPSGSTEELSEEVELLEREFQRQLATGESLLRIRKKLAEVAAQREADDPLAKLTQRIAGHFRDLTLGRYESVTLNGPVPVEVGGANNLPVELLSQGATGSLALATRLALAGLYLEGMDGFVVVDDAFTDMDPERRRAAVECLKQFANDRQVLFFTCHPDHAEELEQQAGGRLVKIDTLSPANY